MYGLVNKALQDFITSQFGVAKWEVIRTKAGVKETFFAGMETYPDEITYKLASSASEVLGISLNDVLEGFGEYWVIYTAQEGYGDMLKMCGDSFIEFLMGLDALHARIQLSFPKLKPPSLKCSDITEHTLHLHYYSDRPGLAPMVVGLVRGLGKRFSLVAEISALEKKSEGAGHDVFFVRF